MTGAHLVQFFLPVLDNDRQQFPREAFAQVRTELTERFGGVTAYLRTPAVGAWEDDDGTAIDLPELLSAAARPRAIIRHPSR